MVQHMNSAHTQTHAPVTWLSRELTGGLLSPTPSVPQLQCQEADSCPTGDKAGVQKDRPSKNIKTVTEEQEYMAPAVLRSELQCKLAFLKPIIFFSLNQLIINQFS